MNTPPPAALAWAAATAGAAITSATGLRDGGSPWLLTLADGDRLVLRTGTPAAAHEFATEAAALRLAAEHGLPAPGLRGHRTGAGAGGEDRTGDRSAPGEFDGPLTLTTVLPGASRIPARATAARLRALGAAAAASHAIPLAPARDLPARQRPIAVEDFAAMRRAYGSVPLLERAERAVAALPMPDAEPVFVHGDLWQGNVLFDGDRVTGVVDWDCAGAGPYGVDLGSLRCDAALHFGPAAPDEVLAGWESAAGRTPAPGTVAYWDAVAALSTPPAAAAWLPSFAGQGRTDLTGAVVDARRDAFLRGALAVLGAC